MEEALKAIAASGPMAVILGYAVRVLWGRLTALRTHYEGDVENDKPGLLARDRAAAQDREDKIRAECDAKLDAAAAVNDAKLSAMQTKLDGMLGELLETLKGLE